MRNQDGVSIITCTHFPFYMDNIFENYVRQTYPAKELIIVLNNSCLNIDDWCRKAQAYEHVKIFCRPESDSVGTCLNQAVKEAHYPYISIFDHDDYYGAAYLEDYMAIAPSIDADVLGKKTHYVFFEDQKLLALIHPGRENCYVDYLINCTFFGKKNVFQKVQFVDSNVVDEQFGADCIGQGIKMYAIGKYNFAYIRRDDLSLHTYKLDNRDLLKQYCEIVTHVDDFRSWVNRSEDSPDCHRII